MYQKSQSYDIWLLRYRVRHINFCHFGSFFALLWKNVWRYYAFIHTCVPYMKIIWYMIPEILGATDRIFCYFRPFFALSPPGYPENQNFEKLEKTLRDIMVLHICTINDNNICTINDYYVWFLRYGGWLTNFFVILDWFLPPRPRKPNLQKNEKNTLTDYQITHVNHKWQSYEVWFLRYGVQQTKCFVIWTGFCPFTPLTTQKIKILKKWKK